MNSEFEPLVSIVIPVYNGSNYMREAIDSALAQTYPNIEVLVINDGSTDDGATHDIAMTYGERIRYFQKENGGVVSALNFGIENMRGDYFAWLSHDDLYKPQKIEKQILALKRHKSTRLAFCVCNCTFINENGEEMYRSYVREDCAFDKPACFLFLGNVGFNGIMVLIPKVLFDRCGQFAPSLATHEYDMWLRIMEIADVVVEPECLTNMRIHPQQVSSLKKHDAIIEIDNFIGKGILDIPPAEFEAFMVDEMKEKGSIYIWGILNSYMWFQNFSYASMQFLKQMRMMFAKPIAQIDELYVLMLGHSEIDEMKRYFIRRLDNVKPLIVIYCDNATDEVLNEISIGIALLSKQCEILLFYQRIEDDKLKLLRDVDVIPIRLMNHSDFNMPLRLGMLCYLLNAKLFWFYNTENRLQHAKVFHFLEIMGIYSISSVRDIDKINVNELNNYNENYIDQKKNLSQASLITSCIAPLAQGSLYYQNVITMPNNSLIALVRWKMIFDVMLKAIDYQDLKNRIHDSLSDIIEKSNISLTDFVNHHVREFVAQVEQKSNELVNTYEQRRFWKLTKPLRLGVWFIRKANKAMKRVVKREESVGSIMSRMLLMLKNRRSST